jgi:hypothetical protein
MTTVFRVRPWESDNPRALADTLPRRLYGDVI